MYHPPPSTAYTYPAQSYNLDETSFGSSGISAHPYQAYPSPEESDPLLLPGSLYPSPTLYSEADSALELELSSFGEGLITPASLYHSPIFEEEVHWISAASEDVIEGVARQHALERELGALEQQVVNNQPSAWELDPEPILSAVPSYTSATTLSPSPTPSSPLSSPASSAGDEEDYRAPSFPTSTCEQQQHLIHPSATFSEHYISLTTLALGNRLAHGILPPSNPDRTSSTLSEAARRQRPTSHHHYDSISKPLARSNKEGISCACSS